MTAPLLGFCISFKKIKKRMWQSHRQSFLTTQQQRGDCECNLSLNEELMQNSCNRSTSWISFTNSATPVTALLFIELHQKKGKKRTWSASVVCMTMNHSSEEEREYFLLSDGTQLGNLQRLKRTVGRFLLQNLQSASQLMNGKVSS